MGRKKLTTVLLVILSFGLVCGTVCQAQVTNTPVTPHYRFTLQRDAIFPGVFGSGTEWGYVRWDAGYLIAWKLHSSPTAPSIAVFDRDGKLVREIVVWIPEAVDVSIEGAAITPSGNLIISGGGLKGNGAVANFIASFDVAGKMQHIIRTNPFVPISICARNDDSVWAYGWDRKGLKSNDYAMLREYSFSRGEVTALLNRNTFPESLLATAEPTDSIGLACNSSKVAMYVAGTRELIKHDVRTPDAVIRQKLPVLADKVHVTSYALTDNGEFFASITDSSKPQIQYGLFQLQASSAQESRWMPIENSLFKHSLEHTRVSLLGAEGDNLVVLSNALNDSVGWFHLTRSDEIQPAETGK